MEEILCDGQKGCEAKTWFSSGTEKSTMEFRSLEINSHDTELPGLKILKDNMLSILEQFWKEKRKKSFLKMEWSI